MTELDKIPDDGTILIFKQFYANICSDAIRRLYSIVPDLDDSTGIANSANPDPPKAKILDGGTDILRAWFRVMVLHESEPDLLEHATQAASINEFLKGRHASEVETYIDFFEKAWRPHALRYLRVATCAQTLAARDVTQIRILGGLIPSSTEGLRMIKPCWDMLHRWLPQLLTPWTLGSICQSFDDYATICKLSMIGLYREHWYDSASPLLNCTIGVYFGFIPSSQSDPCASPTPKPNRFRVPSLTLTQASPNSGSCVETLPSRSDSPIHGYNGLGILFGEEGGDFIANSDNGNYVTDQFASGKSSPLFPIIEEFEDSPVEVECRNYITGQMALVDPMAEGLLDELRKRTERLVVVAYEGNNAEPTLKPSDDDLFIRRRRSANTYDELSTMGWTTEFTLEDIKNNLRLRKTSMYDPIVANSWQVIIIDKTPGLPFSLFDIVQDALLRLAGDPSPREITKQVIRDVIPPAVQEFFLQEITVQDTFEYRFAPPEEPKYEKSRMRCWNPDKALVATERSHFGDSRTRDENRFIMSAIEDMERNGLISLVEEYEVPQTRPILIQGADGALDLYFPYHFEARNDLMQLTTSLQPLPPPDCLLDFARSFKDQHPRAVVAKGSVQTHYCAWPIAAVGQIGNNRLTFATWEGHIYQWRAMPFDRPWADRAWQYCVDHYMNQKFPFVMFYLNTFVICAEDETMIEDATAAILNEAYRHDWKVVVPPRRRWTSDIASLSLNSIFQGLRPA
jgi:hypothetical protein